MPARPTPRMMYLRKKTNSKNNGTVTKTVAAVYNKDGIG